MQIELSKLDLPDIRNVGRYMKFRAWIEIILGTENGWFNSAISFSENELIWNWWVCFTSTFECCANENYLNRHQWQLYWSLTISFLKISQRQASIASANGRNTTYMKIQPLVIAFSCFVFYFIGAIINFIIVIASCTSAVKKKQQPSRKFPPAIKNYLLLLCFRNLPCPLPMQISN